MDLVHRVIRVDVSHGNGGHLGNQTARHDADHRPLRSPRLARIRIYLQARIVALSHRREESPRREPRYRAGYARRQGFGGGSGRDSIDGRRPLSLRRNNARIAASKAGYSPACGLSLSALITLAMSIF